MNLNEGLNRRSFLKGAALMGGAAAFAGMAGCAPQTSASQELSSTSDSAWDKEVDVVIAGAGGGGLNAAARAVQLGADVICVEAMGLPGGNAQEAGMCGILGGYSGQEEKKFAFPSYPFDPKALTDWAMDEYHYAADPHLIYRIDESGGPCIARAESRWTGWPIAACTGVWARCRCTWPRSARRWTTTC